MPLTEVCRRCKSVTKPGLDASRCPRCGWVENRSVEEMANATLKPPQQDSPDRCFYCQMPATKLCDGHQCDRPLCSFHAHQTGSFIACVRGKKGKRSAITDTVDYCPDCYRQREGIHRAAT